MLQICVRGFLTCTEYCINCNAHWSHVTGGNSFNFLMATYSPLHSHKMFAINTLRPRQNGRHFRWYFKCTFLNANVWISIKVSLKFLMPPAQRSWRVVYCFHLVRPSVRPSVDKILLALYLLQYLPDSFHIYTSYQATSEGVSLVKFFRNSKMWSFFKFVNLTSCFDLGSNMNQ